MDRPDLLLSAINAALRAGEEILDVYESDFAVEHKEDRSPLTLADRRAHGVIVSALGDTSRPVLSEEGREIPHEERRKWVEFWMVDPLDGTKEFVKRNGEFTVNIALIREGNPVAGVIVVPVKGTLYFSEESLGAYRVDNVKGPVHDLDALVDRAHKLPCELSRGSYVVVASRSHPSRETEDFIAMLREQHDEVELRSIGSSLKICLVAEGAADVYPRFAPTMEWDTAAGQAIAQAAGRQVIDHATKAPMRYNKANLLNAWFIVK